MVPFETDYFLQQAPGFKSNYPRMQIAQSQNALTFQETAEADINPNAPPTEYFLTENDFYNADDITIDQDP